MIVNFMKGAATASLIAEEHHPFLAERDKSGKVPHCWAEGQWIVYLNTEADIRRAIRYVEENPIKDGLPPQQWGFITPFSGTAV